MTASYELTYYFPRLWHVFVRKQDWCKMLPWGNCSKTGYLSLIKISVMLLWAACVIPLLSPSISSLSFYVSEFLHLSHFCPIHSLSDVLPLPFLVIHWTDSVCSLVSLWTPHPRKHSTIFPPHVTEVSGHGREIGALSWPEAITSQVDQRAELLERSADFLPARRGQRTCFIQWEANQN